MVAPGCSNTLDSERIEKEGYVAGTYISRVSSLPSENETGLSIRVSDFESSEPMLEWNWGPPVLASIVPIAGFFVSPSEKTINAYYGEGDAEWVLKEGEIEKIFVDELRKSGVAGDVEYQGPPKEFELRGSLNLYQHTTFHAFGLGALAYLTVVPIFLLPLRSSFDLCEADLKLVSRNGDVAFERGYDFEVKRFLWLRTEPVRIVGRDVVPKLIKQFIDDLKRSRLFRKRG